MPFLYLKPYNFRNLSDGNIDLLSKEVFFTGLNGQGKSNIIEGLYYSSYGSSFRTRNDSEIIKNGHAEMSLHSMYKEENGSTHTTVISIEKGNKKIERDGKILRDRKELVNTMPCVLYNHDDLDFAIGEPERRRFFIDQSLSMYDILYIDVLRKYKRILKNRNLCLKEQNYELLDTYDIQLIMNGLEIQKKRYGAVFQFNMIFGKLYEQVTGIENVSIKYVSSWKNRQNENMLPELDEVGTLIKSKRESEKILQTTMTGPHRDKIIFVKDGLPFVPTASTGQRRLVALVLRTAQAFYYTQVTGKKPVLLMDDVLLELDPDKRQRMTELLPEYDQLFCTFLPGEPYERYRKNSTRVYEIRNGMWEEVKG